MRVWRSIGYLWMLLAWVMVSSSSAYADTTATVRGTPLSTIGKREKPLPREEEALAGQNGTPYIARLTRERASGNGDWMPPVASLLTPFYTTFYLESGSGCPRSYWDSIAPQKSRCDSTASRAPPSLP